MTSAFKWGVGMVALLLGACGIDNSDEFVVDLGLIEIVGDPAVIEAPASVAVGERFLVQIVSFGGGCTSIERTDVALANDGADIRPFDRTVIQDDSCTNNLAPFSHEAKLAFESSGTKTIRIHGRRMISPGYEVIEVPLTVVVE
jgi:hypothetical protein